MRGWELRDDEAKPIADEYGQLCKRLGLAPVRLDAYVYDLDVSADVKTDHDPEVRSDTADFSEKHSIIMLPIDDRDALLRPITFPPRAWGKHDEDWPLWRIELWHEVVHQVSSHLGLNQALFGIKIVFMEPLDRGRTKGYFGYVPIRPPAVS
jgi:hypothetical protein